MLDHNPNLNPRREGGMLSECAGRYFQVWLGLSGGNCPHCLSSDGSNVFSVGESGTIVPLQCCISPLPSHAAASRGFPRQ